MPIDAGDMHPVVGPLVALLAVAVLSLVLRWTFSTSHRTAPRGRVVRLPATADDYGVLVPVALATCRDDAARLRDALAAGGVRGTLGRSTPDGVPLLVFPSDVDRARDLVR